MTRAFIAEYGGLGANTDSVAAFGTSCFYDSQGNLYVVGSATYGNNSGGAPSGSNTDDSLMLKYSPDGNLLFHKTWWDSSNQNCGATNVAIDIVHVGGTDHILWLANSWGNGGCFYGVMDTNGNIAQGGVDNANAGIGQTSPSDITVNNNGAALISTSWYYTNPNPPADSNYIPAIVSIPNILTSGVPGFSTGIAGLNTDSTLAHGVFNAVVIDDGGYGYAIGNITIDGVQHALLVGLDPSGAVIWQYVIDTISATGTNFGCYGESIALSPTEDAFYTVVNDRYNGVTYLDKWGAGPTSITNIWRSTLAAAPVPGPGTIHGYDVNFDSAGNPIVSGIAQSSSGQLNNGDAQGYPAIAKFDKTTGNLTFVNIVVLGTESGGETQWDGSADPLVGHRCGAVYQDRFAYSCMTIDDLTDPTQTYAPRILSLQVPADGSLAPVYQGGPPGTYINLTSLYVTTVTQFSPLPTEFTVIDLSSQINQNSNAMMAETNATTINNYSSSSITLGQFGNMGLTMRPGVTVRPGAILRGNKVGLTILETSFGVGKNYGSMSGHGQVFGTNGTAGYEFTITDNSVNPIYQLQSPTSAMASALTATYASLGYTLGQAYAWHATFASYTPTTGSMNLGNIGYLTLPNSTAFDQNTGAVTVECWVYPTVPNQEAWLYNQNTPGFFGIYWNANGSFNISQNSYSDAVNGTTNQPTGQWYHVAMCIDTNANSITLYVNGVNQGNQTTAGNYTNSQDVTAIGAQEGGGSYQLDGALVTNLRVTKSSTPVYTGNFTPPANELSTTQSIDTNISAITSGQVQLLLNANSSGTLLTDSSANNFTVTNPNNYVIWDSESPALSTTTISNYQCLVRAEWNPSTFLMIAIDPANTGWQSGNPNSGTALTGKFLFPVTLTPYTPTTDLGNSWC